MREGYLSFLASGLESCNGSGRTLLLFYPPLSFLVPCNKLIKGAIFYKKAVSGLSIS